MSLGCHGVVAIRHSAIIIDFRQNLSFLFENCCEKNWFSSLKVFAKEPLLTVLAAYSFRSFSIEESYGIRNYRILNSWTKDNFPFLTKSPLALIRPPVYSTGQLNSKLNHTPLASPIPPTNRSEILDVFPWWLQSQGGKWWRFVADFLKEPNTSIDSQIGNPREALLIAFTFELSIT